MKHELKAYIEDLTACCRNINEFLANVTLKEYLENNMVKAAVERQFEIIGEILNRMSREYPLAYADIRYARQMILQFHRIHQIASPD